MGYYISKNIRIYILCSVLTVGICTELVCEDFAYDNIDVFNNNVLSIGESEEQIRNCLCNPEICVYKCCPMGEEISNLTCTASNTTRISSLKQYVGNHLMLNGYSIIHQRISCFDAGMTRFIIKAKSNYQTPQQFIITPDITGLEYELEYFCVDYFEEMSDFGGLICIEDQLDITGSNVIGMIISMPFLLATFLVYALLPDRNLPAKALMCYVLSLLFAYILLVTIQLNNLLDSASCKTLAFFCYFFFMASFFWMNASCLDIFFTFSGIRGLLGEKKKENRRFMYYSAYAWGVPVLMVGFAAIFTFEKTDNLTWATGIGEGQCWFRNGWPTGIYFYFPIATLLIVNIVLFSITTYKIKRVQRDTKMLKNVDSRKNRKYDNNDKQRFNLYVKLLFAMGINWSMEVISWAIMWRWSNVPEYVWVLTDFCNAVYGVFIFFIFVFKRNIWMMLKKRYLQFTGRPQQAHTLTSVNRTTVSQVSSSEA